MRYPADALLGGRAKASNIASSVEDFLVSQFEELQMSSSAIDTYQNLFDKWPSTMEIWPPKRSNIKKTDQRARNPVTPTTAPRLRHIGLSDFVTRVSFLYVPVPHTKHRRQTHCTLLVHNKRRNCCAAKTRLLRVFLRIAFSMGSPNAIVFWPILGPRLPHAPHVRCCRLIL